MKKHMPTDLPRLNQEIQGQLRSQKTEVTSRDGLFASTSWTLVFEAAQLQASSSQALNALSELCELYWRPLYLFLRREGFNPDAAQDVTQGFFADLIQNRAYARAQPAKGRFRSFLLGALKRFVVKTHKRDRAKKRGGGATYVPITDATMAEVEAQANYQDSWSCDQVYEREWAAALLCRALDRLGQECAMAGKSALFDCLKCYLSGTVETAVAYEELSHRLGRPTVTLRSDVARLRARYRAILREEVRVTVEEPSQVDDELRYLCQVIARISATEEVAN